MAKAYVFYNPLAGEGKILEDLEALEFVLDDVCILCDMTKPETYGEALFAMDRDDYLVLCGGDGTLNRFVNLTEELHLPNKILYYPAGENNDFALDHGRTYGSNPFPVTDALKDLPRAQIGNRSGHFLTGILFSADGRIHGFSGSKKRYTRENCPRDLRLSVDRAMYHYEKVRFAAVMQGRHCGGGLIPDPERQPPDEALSCVLIHDCGKLRGKYLLYMLQAGRRPRSRCLTLCRGTEIRLTFDGPVTLLTDGELQKDVTECTAWGKEAKQ